MRTTVTIDDHLLARAKQRARERNQTLGDVVEESLQYLFSIPKPRPGAELPVFEGDTGFAPGVDPTSNASMFDAADAGDDGLHA